MVVLIDNIKSKQSKAEQTVSEAKDNGPPKFARI